MTIQTKTKRFKPCKAGYYELAHYFAYSQEHESGETGDRGYNNSGNFGSEGKGYAPRMSFKGSKVYSYSTQIAEKTRGKDNTPILLITEVKHSNTTTKQLDILKQALSHYIRIYMPSIPTWSGYIETEFNPQRAGKIYIERLENYNLLKKEERGIFTHDYSELNKLLQNFDIELSNELILKLDKFKPIYEDLTNNEDKFKQQARKESAQKAALQRKEYKEIYKPIIDKMSYMDKVRIIYEKDVNKLTEKLKTLESMEKVFDNIKGYYINYDYIFKKLREYIQKDSMFNDVPVNYHTVKPSFIWFNDNKEITTSQHVTISNTIEIQKCIKFMELYLNAQSEEDFKQLTGKKINGMYEILRATPEGVRVGCHNIPKQNIIELLKEVA